LKDEFIENADKIGYEFFLKELELRSLVIASRLMPDIYERTAFMYLFTYAGQHLMVGEHLNVYLDAYDEINNISDEQQSIIKDKSKWVNISDLQYKKYLRFRNDAITS
jgi:hypothetical protein